MNQELHRLATFSSWSENPNLKANPLSLAKYGFFYDGKKNELECFQCNFRLIPKNPNDDLQEIHKQKSPGCRLLNERNANNNVPLKVNLSDFDARTRKGDTVTDDASCDTEQLTKKVSNGLRKILSDAMSRARSHGLFLENAAYRIDRSQPDFEILRKEKERLRTFFDWPSWARADPVELARDGTFYTGSEDRVQCVFCRGYMRNWEPTDIPSSEHRKHFPTCPFVRGLDVGNIPIFTNGFIATTSQATTDSIAQKTAADFSENRGPSLVKECLPSTLKEQPQRSLALLSRTDPPKYPEYSEFSVRLQSFRKGVVGQGQTAEALADSGWFYVGPGDKVQCFQCGGNLRDWETGDDPWEEHKRWYEYCQYTKTHRPEPRSRPTDILLPIVPTTAVSYRIEPREVKARMDTPTVRAILDMGYTREMVKAAIEIRLSTTGDDFPNAESLLEALFQLEEKASAPPTGSSASDFDTTASAISSISSASTRSSGYSKASTSLSGNVHQAENALILTTRSNFSNDAVIQSNKSISEKQQSTCVEPAGLIHLASHVSTQKSKSKKKRNKKKKSSAGPDDKDATVDEPVDDVENDQEKPCASGEQSLEEIPDEEAIKYLEENRQLREARTCKVCMDAEVNTVFLPCGHLVCCASCSPQLQNCPMCRTFIRGTVKTFLS